MKIISQKITERIGKKWHPNDEFNKVGEHKTKINIKGKTIDTIFTIRSIPTSCTIKFTDGTHFNFPIANTAWYLDVKYTVRNNILTVIIPLSWYTLSSKYYFITT